jgi:DNA-binding LytR/AlgR family response regulator
MSKLFFSHTFEISQTFKNTTSEYGIVCLIIYGFISFPFFKNQKSLKEIENQKVSDRIKVAHQNKIVILEYKDILYVKAEKPYIAIVTKEKTYLHNSSLKSFITEQSKYFIQIHKSIIVNTDYIVSYSSRKNGDYDILLKNQHIVRASRSFNSNFKPFFESISLK